MTLSELVKKVKHVAKKHMLTLQSLIKGRSFEKFKKKYSFDDVLGSGGFGVVYAGLKLDTYQPVALKYVERRYVTEWGTLNDTRVPMEVCMLARCANVSGTVDLLDFCAIPHGFLIVMERPMMSMDLYSFITQNGHLNEQITRFLMRQIVDTTYAIMTVCKIIHRDVKNENIIIDLVTGQTKLIDFGAATYLKTTKYHGFQGTRLFCPPECFTHSVYLGLEATIWSLGVVFYSMLNGQLPFLNQKDICTKHLLGSLPKFVDYSTEAHDLIQWCLAYEPFKRIKLDKLKRHKWFTEEITASWEDMLSELVQKNTSSTPAKSSSKESGVNTSTQISVKQPEKNQRQDAFNQAERQHVTMTAINTKPLLIRHQANTCIFEADSTQVKKQIGRSKTAKIFLTKIETRAGSIDSGNSSPLTSPAPSKEGDKYFL